VIREWPLTCCYLCAVAVLLALLAGLQATL
jgi:hypothetical protein